jgi:Zn-dependent protease/CBS domain-containing protein
MFGHSWRLGRIAGVEVRVDPSWIFIAVLLAYSFYVQFTITYPRSTTASDITLAVVASVLLFGSVLAHEMAHALFSELKGIRVQDITLFLFGGATRARVEDKGPGTEFLVTIVGPLTSVLLGVVLLIVAVVGRHVFSRPLDGAIGSLGLANLALAVFNLLPGFPLDGGRVLRALLWKKNHSFQKATRTASLAGQTIGWLLIAGGVALLLIFGSLGGLWIAAIGWFLSQSARASYEEILVKQVLRRVEAEDVMSRALVKIPPEVRVREAVDDYFLKRGYGAYPVQSNGQTLGLLTLRDVKDLPREEWDSTPVLSIMEPIQQELTVDASTRMDKVVSRLADTGHGRVLVTDHDEVVGIITPSDISGWLQRWDLLEGTERTKRTPTIVSSEPADEPQHAPPTPVIPPRPDRPESGEREEGP